MLDRPQVCSSDAVCGSSRTCYNGHCSSTPSCSATATNLLYTARIAVNASHMLSSVDCVPGLVTSTSHLMAMSVTLLSPVLEFSKVSARRLPTFSHSQMAHTGFKVWYRSASMGTGFNSNVWQNSGFDCTNKLDAQLLSTDISLTQGTAFRAIACAPLAIASPVSYTECITDLSAKPVASIVHLPQGTTGIVSTVSLTTPTANATIYYTVNSTVAPMCGSAAAEGSGTPTGMLYNASMPPSFQTSLRILAISCATGLLQGNTSAVEVAVPAQPPVALAVAVLRVKQCR